MAALFLPSILLVKCASVCCIVVNFYPCVQLMNIHELLNIQNQYSDMLNRIEPLRNELKTLEVEANEKCKKE